MALGEILVSLITYRESFINISRYDTNVTKYIANWRTVESFLGVAHKVNMFAIEQQCSYAACEPVPVLNISTCKYTFYTLLYMDYILPQHPSNMLEQKIWNFMNFNRQNHFILYTVRIPKVYQNLFGYCYEQNGGLNFLGYLTVRQGMRQIQTKKGRTHISSSTSVNCCRPRLQSTA